MMSHFTDLSDIKAGDMVCTFVRKGSDLVGFRSGPAEKATTRTITFGGMTYNRTTGYRRGAGSMSRYYTQQRLFRLTPEVEEQVRVQQEHNEATDKLGLIGDWLHSLRGPDAVAALNLITPQIMEAAMAYKESRT